MAERNGNGWKNWILTALFAAVMALSSVAWSGHENRIAKIEAYRETHDKAASDGFARLAVVETNQEHIKRQNDLILQEIRDLKAKLERRR